MSRVRFLASEATKPLQSTPATGNNVQGKPIPSPAVPPGIAGKLLGHAAFFKKVPGSRQSPFYLLNIKRKDWYKETGSKTILVNMAGNKIVWCSEPPVYRDVLVAKQASFTNSNSFRHVFGFLFPKSMIVLEGEDWQRVRRISQKALNRMNLDAAVGAVAEVIDTAINCKVLGDGSGEEEVDTFRHLSHITFDAFHKVMYGMDPNTVKDDPKNPSYELLRRCEALLNAINGRAFATQTKFLWKLPTKQNRELEANRKYILSVGQDFAKKRRELVKNQADKAQTKTLIDALLLSQEEDAMTDQEVSDQIATFFFGAYETTSNTLLFTLNSLADAPHIQQKLREAVLARFPNGSKDIAKATLAELDEVKYLVWTLEESFRLNSTAEAFPRDAIEDVVVGGYMIKKGTTFLTDHATVSRDPEFFPGQNDLDDFNPGRYENFHLDKFYSMPFGFGGRICPGRRIAIAEIKAILAILVSEYEILPAKDPSKKLLLDVKLGLTCVDGTGYLRFKRRA